MNKNFFIYQPDGGNAAFANIEAICHATYDKEHRVLSVIFADGQQIRLTNEAAEQLSVELARRSIDPIKSKKSAGPARTLAEMAAAANKPK